LVADLADGLGIDVEQDMARAERLLLEALERNPNEIMGPAIMGVLRRNQHRVREALLELNRAISMDRNNVWAVREMGCTLGRVQPDAAIPYLEKAIRFSATLVFMFVF
jgi:hypothetical protein